jgi:hypothetical protein
VDKGDQKMRTGLAIKMDRHVLLSKVEEQRRKHLAEYELALAGWREKMTAMCMMVVGNYKKLIAQLPNEVLSQSLEDNPIKRRIANAEVALMEARTRYGADNPRVLLMEDSLREMRKTMTSESYNDNRERVYVENPVKREFETELLKLEAEKQVLEQSVQKIEERVWTKLTSKQQFMLSKKLYNRRWRTR